MHLIQAPIVSHLDDHPSPPTSIPTFTPAPLTVYLPLSCQTSAVKTQVRSYHYSTEVHDSLFHLKQESVFTLQDPLLAMALNHIKPNTLSFMLNSM